MSDENKSINETNMSQEEMSKIVYQNSVKALRLQRISTACMVGVLLLVAITVITLVPRVVAVSKDLNSLIDSAQTTIENADKTLEDISGMADSLQQAGDKMDSILADNESVLVESMDKISNIDFDGLNKGIKELQEAVGPLAKFMSRFK